MNRVSLSLSARRFCQIPGVTGLQENVSLEIGADAVIATSEAGAAEAGLVVTSPVNAHDHGYGVRTLACGCMDDALESWIAYLRLRPRTDPYLEALVAFGRLASNGIGITMHCHNSLNAARLVEEAGAVVRAAGDVGIRLALSCPLLDRDPWIYGGPEKLRQHVSAQDWAELEPIIPRYAAIDAQLQAVDAIAEAHAGPTVTVQYGPIGPQWCSDGLLEAIAEASSRTGRRIHMHLLESPRQRRWLDQRFSDGIVSHLDRIGFLSPRLAVAHGVQLRPAEIELLAERGVQLVSNPSANLRLRSGVAPLQQMVERRLPFAVGLDGTGLDDDQDLWREMRLLHLLHQGRLMETQLPAASVFDAAMRVGRSVAGFEALADLTVVDYAALSSDLLFDDLELADILLARMSARNATGLVVNGRWVMRDNRLIGIDFEAAEQELEQQARRDLPRLAGERKAATLLGSAINRYYRDAERRWD